MENKKKNKLERLRDWWERIQIKRRRHQSFWYMGYFSFAVCVYTFLLTCGLFLEKPETLRSAQVGQTVVLGSVSYELVEKEFDREAGRAAFVLANPKGTIPESEEGLSGSLEFVDATENDTQLRLYSGEKGYHVFVVEKLPEKWKALRVLVKLSEQEDQLILHNKSEPETKVQVRTEQSVLVDSVNHQIQQKQEEIQTKQKSLGKNREEVKRATEKIATLRENMAYETDKEQQLTEGVIRQIEESTVQLKNKQAMIESEISELKEQIEKGKQKINDLKK